MKSVARRLKYRLYFHCTARGERPVRQFLRALPRKHRIKCASYLNMVRVQGTGLPKIYVEKIADNLWEVKPEYENNEYRFLLGVIGPGRLGVVTALKKKRARLPRKVFDQAMRLIEEMRNE